MPTATILIGLPATGKSFYVDQNNLVNANTVVLSTDYYIEKYAIIENKTYNEVFQDCIKIATSDMMDDLEFAKLNNLDIVWDQTNLSIKSRTNKIKLLKDYEIHAVVFGMNITMEEHFNRLNSRVGKSIPDFVMKTMKASYQEPTKEEGFISITYA